MEGITLLFIEVDISNLLRTFLEGWLLILDAHYNRPRSFKDILMPGPRIEAAKCSHPNLGSDLVSTIFSYMNFNKLLTPLFPNL